jgi:SAM-dependent methyltransferase
MRKLIPKKLRNTIKNSLGITALNEQIEKLNERTERIENINKLLVDDWERSRIRWSNCDPDSELTWGVELDGGNFISKVNSFNVFANDKSILEIGPGYGRLLEACIAQKVPYRNFDALDLSLNNVNFLKGKFSETNITFIHGDIEKVTLNAKYDILISSLTFKHLYPTFVNGLRNISKFLSSGSMLFFDLMEGDNLTFEKKDDITYIKEYSQEEIKELLASLNIDIVAFDYVYHDPQHKRLFVAAIKTDNL